MTGRQKIEAAFSGDGSREIPAVICYENIYIRDNWDQLTNCPWWFEESFSLEEQMAWRLDAFKKIGQDWFFMPKGISRTDRENSSIEARQDGIYKVNKMTGFEIKMVRPPVGGSVKAQHTMLQQSMLDTYDDIERIMSKFTPASLESIKTDGRTDLSRCLLNEFSKEMFCIRHVSSPLWCCYDLWGFEGLMVMIGSDREMVKYACRKYLDLAVASVRESAALGAEAIWVEECFTDMISLKDYRELCLPFLMELLSEIRMLGMKSIYYFTGKPGDKIQEIISAGADALSFEESKKDFKIDVEELAGIVNGKCAILGNLDSIGILQEGSEELLRSEVSRQIGAGRRNKSRFIMSLGSPVTPSTPISRVRLYCDLVHETGSR